MGIQKKLTHFWHGAVHVKFNILTMFYFVHFYVLNVFIELFY